MVTSSASPAWVIVAGACGAIGRKVVSHYCGSGRKVMALDRQRFEAGDSSGSFVSRCVDLNEAPALDQVLSELVSRAEPVGLLINAAGLIWSEPIISLRGASLHPHSIDGWERVIQSNLTATFITGSRVAARMARTGGGSIVNFSSIAAAGNAGQAAYSAAKAGIEGLTRSMAKELGPVGVRVNAIAPGFIDVPTTRNAVPEKVLSDYVERTPLRRLGTVEDLLLGIELLERNTFMTGTVLHIDGGLRL